MTLQLNRLQEMPYARVYGASPDIKAMQENFETLMGFNQKKILVDTKVAMLDSASDSLSKALNANIKQSDNISF
ncbi:MULTISPECIES: hypothetical protein [Vibrio]|uniref:hypothetical protein n=1 Tax=Vibrio TaxID=662 RepID=UPI0002EDD76C|nr:MULTISPECIES: hypothetical protein [Vibrio]MDE3898675.1 hypothetical protein [Vibrio sp. CC007]